MTKWLNNCTEITSNLNIIYLPLIYLIEWDVVLRAVSTWPKQHSVDTITTSEWFICCFQNTKCTRRGWAPVDYIIRWCRWCVCVAAFFNSNWSQVTASEFSDLVVLVQENLFSPIVTHSDRFILCFTVASTEIAQSRTRLSNSIYSLPFSFESMQTSRVCRPALMCAPVSKHSLLFFVLVVNRFREILRF